MSNIVYMLIENKQAYPIEREIAEEAINRSIIHPCHSMHIGQQPNWRVYHLATGKTMADLDRFKEA